MLVALTNDDGIDAPGIRRLAAEFGAAGHEVVVAAPEREYSGAGASTGADLTQRHGIEVSRRALAGFPAFAVAGPPAVCALLLIRGLFDRTPDVLVSGINHGTNMGPSVTHSGTVGAAITAANFGYRAVAVSLDTRGEVTADVWTAAARAGVLVADRVAANEPHGAVANVNVPCRAAHQIKGLRNTVLDLTPGFRSTGTEVTQRVDQSRHRIRFTYEHLDAVAADDTDVAAVLDGYVSISWLRSITSKAHPAWADQLDGVWRAASRADGAPATSVAG
jgi:5'-nucleotidase